MRTWGKAKVDELLSYLSYIVANSQQRANEDSVDKIWESPVGKRSAAMPYQGEKSRKGWRVTCTVNVVQERR